MKKLSLNLLLGLLLPATAWTSDWTFGDKTPANRIEVKPGDTAASLAIGRSSRPSWRWASANGIGFKKAAGPDGELYVTKIAGGKTEFSLVFEFTKPLKKFRFISPRCQGLALEKGDIVFEYATGEKKEFKELCRVSVKTPGYVRGGQLPPQQSPWIEFAANQPVTVLTLRTTINGYVSRMIFSGGSDNGGIIEYETSSSTPAAAEVSLKLFPDAARLANCYYADQPPRFLIKIDPAAKTPITEIALFDAGRKKTAGNCRLISLGDSRIAELPPLPPGTYDFTARSGEKVCAQGRIALLPRPRNLTWPEIRESPFGIVGIARDGRFRESADLNAPALGQMMGVHQARTGGGPSWVGVCNGGPGKYAWPEEPASQALRQAGYGIVLRNGLSWTPVWAVDKSRIKGKDWFGHYPPKKEHLQDFAEFCRRSAARNRNVFESEYEIWNEPNNEPFGSFKGTFEEFVELCLTAAKAVHEVDPQAKMILGTTGDADVGYIARLLKAGLSQHYAIVDIHPYRHTRQGPEDGLLGDINRLKRVIQKYGNHQAIIFSEVGWPTSSKDQPSYQKVSESEQACFNSRTLLISLAAGVKRIHFHMLTDWGKKAEEPEHNFGFVKISGEPKLTVSAVSTTARNLERAEFIGKAAAPPFHHLWYWKTPWQENATLVTVWADTQCLKKKPEWLTLSGTLLQAEDLWGGTPGKDRLIAGKNEIRVLPGADPLFLYVRNADRRKLEQLPPDLRPNLIKRALTQALPAGDIDFNHLAVPMIAATATKTMGYAGIGDNGAVQTEPAVTGEKDSSFAVYQDDRGLTLAVNVKSGRPMKNNHSGWWVWAGDCVRLYIGKNQEPYMTPEHYQLCLAPVTADNGPPQAVLISYDAANGLKSGDIVPGVVIKATNTASGWAMSATIPWSFFPGKPKKGDQWRFDLSVPGAKWNNPADDNWSNPQRWGVLEFR